MPNTVSKIQTTTKNPFYELRKFGKFFLMLPLLVIYMFTLSPLVEPIVENGIVALVRNSSGEKFNFLTPVYATGQVENIYDLRTITSQNPLDQISSRSKFYVKDPRVLAMSEFLYNYNSPMTPYAQVAVEEADKYGLDWRLIIAISGVESAFGNLIPKDSYNGWGWRGRNANEEGWSIFSSWDEAIIHITERMALGYGTNLTPFQIQNTYCPPCGESGLDLWAHGVTRFMNELDFYLNNLERE
jgi:hypothetical protein